MAFVAPKDRVIETSTSNSQTVFALAGAVDTSFNRFSASMSVGDATFGAVVEPGTAFAVGILTYSATNQITVTSAFDSKGTFSSGGTKEVFMGLPAGMSAGLLDATGALDQVRFNTTQTINDVGRARARGNVYAAPFDAMSYDGMQVNGHHAISQENGDNAVAFPTGTLSKYVTDNWRVYKTGTSVLSVARVASGIDGIPYALQASVTTAQTSIGTDVALFGTYVEGSRFARAAWGSASAVPVSVGFWFKAAAAGTYSLVAYNFDASSSQSANVTIATPNLWTYCTATFGAKTSGTWKTDANSGFELQVVFAGGSSPNTLSGAPAAAATIAGLVVMAGIQLPAAADLPRVLRPNEQEAIQCDRLWQTFGGSYSGNSYTFGTGTTAVSNVGVINIRLRGAGMRAPPALTISAASDFNLLDGSSFTPSSISLDSADAFNTMLSLAISGATVGKGLWLRSANANARMHFNSRF